MIPYAALILGLFWAAAIKLWFTDGPKIPVICIILWFSFFFGVPLLHLPGIIFIVAEAILALGMFLVDRYKSALL
jgi:hypothetical protein